MQCCPMEFDPTEEIVKSVIHFLLDRVQEETDL